MNQITKITQCLVFIVIDALISVSCFMSWALGRSACNTVVESIFLFIHFWRHNRTSDRTRGKKVTEFKRKEKFTKIEWRKSWEFFDLHTIVGLWYLRYHLRFGCSRFVCARMHSKKCDHRPNLRWRLHYQIYGAFQSVLYFTVNEPFSVCFNNGNEFRRSFIAHIVFEWIDSHIYIYLLPFLWLSSIVGTHFRVV